MRSGTSEMDIDPYRGDFGLGTSAEQTCPGTGNPLCRYYFGVRPTGATASTSSTWTWSASSRQAAWVTPQLLDADCKTRTLAEFRGQAVLMFFGFTQCPDVCPTALIRAARTREWLGALGSQLKVIFVTIDPERDTPQVLKAYTTAFDPGFIGLHGSLQETATVAKDFKVFYKKVPTGSSYTMDHSAMSYVYDRSGQLRLALRHDQTAEQYAQDLRRLLS